MSNKQRLKASHAFYLKAETCDIFDISSAAFFVILQFRLTSVCFCRAAAADLTTMNSRGLII